MVSHHALTIIHSLPKQHGGTHACGCLTHLQIFLHPNPSALTVVMVASIKRRCVSNNVDNIQIFFEESSIEESPI